MWQALIGFLVTTLLIPTALGNLAWLCTERTEGKMCNDATPIHPAAASKYTAEIKGNVGKLVYLDVPGGVGGHVCALARQNDRRVQLDHGRPAAGCAAFGGVTKELTCGRVSG
eukprot:326488-Prorocentrum_minimum.AAC.2